MNKVSGGFIFTCESGSLGKSEYLDGKNLDAVPIKKRNHDDLPLVVNCGNCDTLMDFISGPKNDLDGKWICPVCGAKVDEVLAYQELNEENNTFLKENDLC